jgi:cytochrome c556
MATPSMRSLILMILGLAFGAICTAIAMNALAQRSAYARGVMQVMQHHYAELRNGQRTGRCDAATVTRDRDVLRMLSDEVAPSVYGDGTPDPPFREYIDRLHSALADLGDGTQGCAALAATVNRLGDSCDACHRQYR